jgi:hypothetical protein
MTAKRGAQTAVESCPFVAIPIQHREIGMPHLVFRLFRDVFSSGVLTTILVRRGPHFPQRHNTTQPRGHLAP